MAQRKTKLTPPQYLIEKAIQRGLPIDRPVWYRSQYKKCNKYPCKCHNGAKHGPYWHAKFNDAGDVQTVYLGKAKVSINDKV